MKNLVLLLAATVLSLSVYATNLSLKTAPAAGETYDLGCTFNGAKVMMKEVGQTDADDVVESPEALKGGKYRLSIFANNKSYGLECVPEKEQPEGQNLQAGEETDIGCTYNGEAVKVKIEGEQETVVSPEALKGGLIEPTIVLNGQYHQLECADEGGSGEQ